MERDRVKVRDLPPTSLRLPAELREVLQREAFINGRSLSGEILMRLRLSIENPQLVERLANVRSLSGPPAYAVYEAEPSQRHAPQLGDQQRLLLSLFNGLPPDKQLALITFLRR